MLQRRAQLSWPRRPESMTVSHSTFLFLLPPHFQAQVSQDLVLGWEGTGEDQRGDVEKRAGKY